MDRIGRSWPWRKKFSDRSNVTASSEIIASVQSDPSKHNDEHDVSRIMESKSDNSMTRWQQAEEKLKGVNEKLISALSDNALKDNTVKQHSKVAEEAVLGWEKAEAEAAALKVQLDSTLQIKAAAEDQLSQVDGALKECMLELRHVKEENEKKITETVMQNTRHWEKVRVEFEAKLAALNQQVIESEAENKGLSRTVQERGSTIVELTDGKSQAEAKVSVLHIQLGMMEKEKSSLKYELHVLSKELEIRNEEREYSKRELEVCSRQNLENAKKIAKLEAECQKLRTLVRRKLPGPAAIAQMKLEVESLGYEIDDTRRRRSVGKSVSSSSGFSMETVSQRWQNGNKDMGMLLDRMHGMEEETKMLKEILAQRNSELQAARLLCARTATKLSSVESHLEAMSNSSATLGIRNIGVDPNLTSSRSVENNRAISIVSMSESSINPDDQASCADNWDSSLVSELAQIKKEKVATNMENMLDPSKLKLMDDFTEMEHFALKMESETVGSEAAEVKDLTDSVSVVSPEESFAEKQSPTQKPIVNEYELHTTKEICSELRSKLSSTEKQLSYLEEKNRANDATIISLQEKLDVIFEAQAQNADMDAVLKQAKASVADICYQGREASIGTSLDNTTPQQPSQIAAVQDTRDAVTEDAPALSAPMQQTYADSPHKQPIHKVISLIEALALAVGLECRNKAVQHLHEGEDLTNAEKTKDESMQNSAQCEGHTKVETSVKTDAAPSGPFWENINLDRGMQRILRVSDKLIQWESFVEFMQELSIILDIILGFASGVIIPKGRKEEPCNACSQASEGQNISFGPSKSAANNSDEQGIDIKDIKILNLTAIGEIGVSNSGANENFGGSSTAGAVEFDVLKDSSKYAQIQEVSEIKSEKQNVEQRLEATNERIKNLKSHLHDDELHVLELKEKLVLSQESEQSTNSEALSPLELSKANQEYESKSYVQVAQIQDKLTEMQLELQKEQKQHEDSLSRIKDLEEQFNRVMSNTENSDQVSIKAIDSELSQESPDQDGKLRKEREIAAATEKLEECQKTILVLGTQLKALKSPQDTPIRSAYRKAKSPCSKQDFEPYYCYSAEMGTERAVNNLQAHCGRRPNQGRGWSRLDRDREVESQWSPPRYMAYSPHAPRRQVGAGIDYKTRAYRKSDMGYYESDDFKSPDKSGCFDELNVAASPSDDSQHTPANSSLRYPVVRKTGSSISDLSKAFQAVDTKSASAKRANSGLSRFFSRSKKQTK